MTVLKFKSNTTDRLKVHIDEYVNINADGSAHVVINTPSNEIIAFPSTYFLMPETVKFELHITKLHHEYIHDLIPLTLELPVLNDRNYIIELHDSSEGRVCEVSTHLEHR